MQIPIFNINENLYIGYTNGFDLIFKFVNNKFIVSMIPTIGTFSINIEEY